MKRALEATMNTIEKRSLREFTTNLGRQCKSILNKTSPTE